MAELFTLPKARPLTTAGKIRPGSKLTFTLVGSLTEAAIYTDSACTIQHDNPVIADANGEFAAIYMNAQRDAYLTTAADAAVWGPITCLAGESAADISYVPSSGASAIVLQTFLRVGTERTAGEIAAGVTPSNYAYPADPEADPRRYGGTADGATNNTAHVQSALNSLPDDATGIGGTVRVPKNYRFNLSSLTFPQRSTLIYFGGDDLSDSSLTATNEWRFFQANANPFGIVNEQRFEAGFHPGFVVNVRKSITGHSSFLGAGQTQLNPARASINIFDDDIERFRLIHEIGSSYSALYGFRLHAYVRRVVITGVTTASFVTDPVVGELITGVTSGAKGFLVSIDGSGMVLEWFSGTFVVGDALTDVNETSSTTIATVTQTSVEGHALFSSYSRGYWGIAVRPNEQTVPFSVGGPIAIGPTQDLGQYIATTHTNTILKLQDAFAGTPAGRELMVDNAITAANRRVTYRDLAGTVNKGMVGGLAASVTFSDGAPPAISTSAYNIASIARTSTGIYTVTFTHALARADFGVQVSGNTFADIIRYGAKTTSTVRVESFNAAGAATNLTGEVSLSVFCGDI